MSNCVFMFIGVCPHTSCNINCPKYTSANGTTGIIIIDDFTDRVEKVVEPIRTELRNKYFEESGL